MWLTCWVRFSPAAAVGDFDQLQVVDDEQIEAAFHLVPPRLAAEVTDRRVRIVVDVERVPLQIIEERAHPLEIARRQFALLELPRVDAEDSRR